MSRQNLKAVKGMKDLLPNETPTWHYIEQELRNIMQRYAYHEIRMPIVEPTQLFKRAIGDETDIVSKEMYSFEDQGHEQLTLRPEGTASCVRACIEHGLLYNKTQKLWYLGPMFRRERPQKGRQRQFYQFGVESFGVEGPDVDLEQIMLMARFWRKLGLDKAVKLELNSLGTLEERIAYTENLVEYLKRHESSLDEDSKRRLTTNPLRILDSKNPALSDIIANCPKLLDFLGEKSKSDFDAVCSALDNAGVKYTINPNIVRGLDYYTHIVYEWTTDLLGAQNAVCAGGRYDKLVEQLGGKPCAAVGFALGIERLVLLYNEVYPDKTFNQKLDVYLVASGDNITTQAISICEQIRDHLPFISIATNCGGGSFKSQFKRADASLAKYAVIIGESELKNHKFGVKHLRDRTKQEQFDLSLEDLIIFLRSELE